QSEGPAQVRRLRLLGIHPRHDLPGLGYQPAEHSDPSGSITTRTAVVRLRLDDSRDHRQSGRGLAPLATWTNRESSPQAVAPSVRAPWLRASRPERERSQATRAPKAKPPTWAKKATPPPFAFALKNPKFASTS